MAPGRSPRDDDGVGMQVEGGTTAVFDAAADGLFGASIVLAQLDEDAAPANRLIAQWATRTVSSNTDSARRYPWPIETRFAARPPYVPEPTTWRAWRPSEEAARLRDPDLAEARLLTPPIIVDACELLDRLAEAGNQDASAMLDEALPVMRRDLARDTFGGHAWGDTWALWNLARRPRAGNHAAANSDDR